MAHIPQHTSEIVGWGADLDKANRPAVPMENFPLAGTGAHWADPEQQIPKMKIYHSIERPSITPVFGTSTPPSGVSGKIRDVAYKLSENDIRHWLLLLFADRVNVVEGIFQDFSKGYIPNIFKEMGWTAEWKYNRKGAQKKAALAVGIVSVMAFMLVSRRHKKMIEE